MAITFVQQEKRQKYLLFVFAGVILLALVILWRGFLTPSAPSPAPAEKLEVIRPIEINFDLFDHPFFAQIEEFPRIPDFESTIATEEMRIGRPNPFAPIGGLSLPTERKETEAGR